MNVHITGMELPDYLHWMESDRVVLARWWSRRITGEHRLVYRVAGVAGRDQRVEIVGCRYHY